MAVNFDSSFNTWYFIVIQYTKLHTSIWYLSFTWGRHLNISSLILLSKFEQEGEWLHLIVGLLRFTPEYNILVSTKTTNSVHFKTHLAKKQKQNTLSKHLPTQYKLNAIKIRTKIQCFNVGTSRRRQSDSRRASSTNTYKTLLLK